MPEQQDPNFKEITQGIHDQLIEMGFRGLPDGNFSLPEDIRVKSHREAFNDMHYEVLLDKNPEDRQFLSHLREAIGSNNTIPPYMDEITTLQYPEQLKLLAKLNRELPEDTQLEAVRRIREYLEDKSGNSIKTYITELVLTEIIVDQLPKYLDSTKNHKFFEKDFIAARELAEASKFMEGYRTIQVVKAIAEKMNDGKSFSDSLTSLENRQIKILDEELDRGVFRDKHIYDTEPEAARDFAKRFIGLQDESEIRYIAGIAAAYVRNENSSIKGYLKAIDRVAFIKSVEEKMPSSLLPLSEEHKKKVENRASDMDFSREAYRALVGYGLVEGIVEKLTVEEQAAADYHFVVLAEEA